jgi:hypothetical protein
VKSYSKNLPTKIGGPISKHVEDHLLTRWFLARLIFDPEEGGATLFRKVGSYTWRYIPDDDNYHNGCCENLKSYKVLTVQG